MKKIITFIFFTSTILCYSQINLKKIKKSKGDIEKQIKHTSNSNLNNNSTSLNDLKNYFRKKIFDLNYIYSDASIGARAANGLNFYSNDNIYKTQKRVKDFTKQRYLQKVEEAKALGYFEKLKPYIQKVLKALDDYPNFISKSQDLFNGYVGYVNQVGIKGDTQKEIEQLKRAQTFCEILLQFAPNNPTATQWYNQVEKQINAKGGSINYASVMHKTHLGEILFSDHEVSIGNETENDFKTEFKSGDYIFATLYLPSKVRKLTDSYAQNDMEVKINGMVVAEPSYTAIWVTTPMQEKNYLQFAILPDAKWKETYGKNYTDNKLRTHEAIAEQLIEVGSYSGISVAIKVKFRGTHSTFKGTFNIDQSGGIEQLKTIQSKEIDSRLNNVTLPKAGMTNPDLEKQALTIMQNKSKGSGKTYSKAIITSANWDYNKTYAGVTVSRSIVIALVSKEYDGKCMFQYFNFIQQEKGNGNYNTNLEFDGAGDNVYMSCENID